MRPRWIALALGAIWLLLATIPAVSTAHMSSTPTLDASAGISARSSLNSVIGENDERIGDVAPTRDAFEPDIAYNPVTNQYLLVYARPREGGGSNEFEIYGQFIDAATGALMHLRHPGLKSVVLLFGSVVTAMIARPTPSMPIAPS